MRKELFLLSEFFLCVLGVVGLWLLDVGDVLADAFGQWSLQVQHQLPHNMDTKISQESFNWKGDRSA